jgi:NAD-dependent DNA ligase
MSVLFLDIETTGLSRYSDEITSVVWHYEKRWNKWVNGVDSNDLLIRHWKESQTLITYNGKCFDEPFICKFFGVDKHSNHIDLRFYLSRQGLKGGLKKISEGLGIGRDVSLQDVDGYDAVRLWRLYNKGDTKALEALLFYNAWDVLLLKHIYKMYLLNELDIVPFPFVCDKVWLDGFLNGSLPKITMRSTRTIAEKTDAIVKEKSLTQNVNINGEWYGNVICFTGTLVDNNGNKLLRKDAQQKANELGFVFVENVQPGSTHLVSGSLDFASKKLLTAKQLGVSILSTMDFIEILFEHSISPVERSVKS